MVGDKEPLGGGVTVNVGVIVGATGVEVGGGKVGTAVESDAICTSWVGVTYITIGGCGEQETVNTDSNKKAQKRREKFSFIIGSIVSQSNMTGYKNSLRVGEASGKIVWYHRIYVHNIGN